VTLRDKGGRGYDWPDGVGWGGAPPQLRATARDGGAVGPQDEDA
jgi:hypothetical protein